MEEKSRFPFSSSTLLERPPLHKVLVLEAIIEDSPFVLARIFETIGELGGNILNFIVSASREGKRAIYICVEHEKREGLVNSILNSLKKIKGVERISTPISPQKVTYSQMFFPPVISGIPSVLMQVDNIAKIYGELVRTYGSNGAMLVLMSMGRETGKALASIVKGFKPKNIYELLEYMKAIYVGSGRGFIERIKIIKNEVTIIFDYLVEKTIKKIVEKMEKAELKYVFEPEFLKHFIQETINVKVLDASCEDIREKVVCHVKLQKE